MYERDKLTEIYQNPGDGNFYLKKDYKTRVVPELRGHCSIEAYDDDGAKVLLRQERRPIRTNAFWFAAKYLTLRDGIWNYCFDFVWIGEEEGDLEAAVQEEVNPAEMALAGAA